MKQIKLVSWSFVHVMEMIMELARRGGVDLDIGFLKEMINARTWELLDQLGRDLKHQDPLTPDINTISRIARSYDVAEEVSHLLSAGIGADSLTEFSLGEIGYTALSNRSTSGKLLYAIANKIQGDPHHSEGLPQRKNKAEKFLAEFYGYGSNNLDPELQLEKRKYELQLGVLFCHRIVAVLTEHPELELTKLTHYGFMKYGLRDHEGNCSCYWCTGSPCLDGGRKGGIKAIIDSITPNIVYRLGLPEMAYFMWVVYGGSRNSAVDALAGPVRSLSEHGGEFSYVSMLKRYGGVKGIRQKLGCLFLDDTRHVVMALKKEAEGVPIDDSLYAEAADAVISWPCLVHQAFGFDFVRSIQFGLEHMAKGAGVKLETPADLTKTVSGLLYKGKWAGTKEYLKEVWG